MYYMEYFMESVLYSMWVQVFIDVLGEDTIICACERN